VSRGSMEMAKTTWFFATISLIIILHNTGKRMKTRKILPVRKPYTKGSLECALSFSWCQKKSATFFFL
jgi:hypothetical protein